MTAYLFRRLLLMIPTLFGVTVISFVVMQMAPGDPLSNQLGAGGTQGQSGDTREAYLLRRRELKLDRPLVLNFNYFRDYQPTLRQVAFWLGRTPAEIVARLSAISDASRAGTADATALERLKFLRSLEIEHFDARLADPAERDRLAAVILGKLDLLCRDLSIYAVADAIGLLESPQADVAEKIGVIRALNLMVAEPLVYTYSRDPQPEETPRVLAVWKTWWDRAQKKYPPLGADDRAELEKRFQSLLKEPSRAKLFEEIEFLDPEQMRFFAEKLLGPSTLDEKFLAAIVLRTHVRNALRMDVGPGAALPLVEQVTENWRLAHFDPRREEYEPRLAGRLWSVVADTQYAHMAWRLVTFNFGHSALKTREPVSEKIWNSVKVTAPLMLFAELVIYLVAVPLGILCAVSRGGWTDRLISLVLFFLYSIPGFIAGMLFLLLFAYGDVLKWFPMLGLRSEGANQLPAFEQAMDYVWHTALPVLSLALFSLASMAMFSRSAMLDVIGQDYIRTARAKGLSESKVILKHALRNALIPIITIFANFLPAMLGGSVLIEVLFTVPGMGQLSFESILLKDYPTLMAMIYLDAILVMLSILLTDVLYVVVDPRISFAGRGQTA